MAAALSKQVLRQLRCRVFADRFISRYKATVSIISAMHHCVRLEVSSIHIGIRSNDRGLWRSLQNTLEILMGTRRAHSSVIAIFGSFPAGHVRL